MNKKSSALLVIDVQNDFCPGGALEVPDGDKVVPVINNIMGIFPLAVGTQDWHPADHRSFASQHSGKNPYDTTDLHGVEQVLWPDHCVQGSAGAAFHSDLNTLPLKLIIRKGTHPEIDSYSAFLENDGKTETGLHGYLRALAVSELYLCGLATDYCVFFSAMDAVKYGFTTYLIEDACRGIDVPAGNIASSYKSMKEAGVKIIQSTDLS